MYRTSSREESMLKSPSRMFSYTIGTTIRNEISIESLSDETHSSASIMNEATGTVRIILKGSDMKSLAIRSRYETAERISPLKIARKKPVSMFLIEFKTDSQKILLADRRQRDDKTKRGPGRKSSRSIIFAAIVHMAIHSNMETKRDISCALFDNFFSNI